MTAHPLALTLCLLLGGLVNGAALAAKPALPTDSIYWLEADFSDQTGRHFSLVERRNRPQLVAMFYSSCRYMCPLIIDHAKSVDAALTPTERTLLDILLVSMDPERDDTAALNALMQTRKLDPNHWTLARTNATNVRALAALLGVRYRALTDGEFNHTSLLLLLDAEGRLVAKSTIESAKPNAEFMAAVRKLLTSTPTP